MSPEFYAIIGVGVSLAGFLTGLLIFFSNQINKRLDSMEDRTEARFDRLEAAYAQLMQHLHSLELRVSKLEWMLEAVLHGGPATLRPAAPRPEPQTGAPSVSYLAKERAAARRRLRRRRAASRPANRESSAP